MEVILILLGAVIVFGLALFVGQLSMKSPVSTWTDEQLEKRRAYYVGVIARKFQAAQFDERSSAKIKEIEAEIAARRTAQAITVTIKEMDEGKAAFQTEGMTEKAALDAVMEEWKDAQAGSADVLDQGEDGEGGLPTQRCMPCRDASPDNGWLVFRIDAPDDLKSLCRLVSSTQAEWSTISRDTEQALVQWARERDAGEAAALLRQCGLTVSITEDPAEGIKKSFARLGIGADIHR